MLPRDSLKTSLARNATLCDRGDMSATATLQDVLRARRDLPAPAMRRALRAAAGISLEAVAREVGVTRQAVGHWEAGSRYPSGRHLQKYLVLAVLREHAAGGASP